MALYLAIIQSLNVLLDIDGPSSNGVALGGGVGLGTIIAIVISWSKNKSILWAIIHGFFGWLYVIYYMITRD